MKLIPLGDRVVVEPIAAEESTASGIILPDTVDKEKKAEGKILAVGDGEKIKKLNLAPGDRVIFGKYAGEDVEIEDIEYKVLSHEDVLAKLEK